MSHPDSLQTITFSLRSPFIRTRTLVLEIMGAVCLIPGGHRRILESLSSFAKVSLERKRFEVVAACLAADMMQRNGMIRGSGDEKWDRIIDLQVFFHESLTRSGL